MANRTKPYLNGGVVYERIYTFILYPDSTTYICSDVLDIVSNFDDFAFILHDCDDVKPHYHVLVRFSERKQLNTFASELGIPENIIKWRNNFNESFKYLTHENKNNLSLPDSERKHIYSHDLLISSLDESSINKIFSKSNQDKLDLEMSQAVSIVDFLESENYKNFRDVIRWACKTGNWSTLRRGGSMFSRCYDEVMNERLAKEFHEKRKIIQSDGKYKKVVGDSTFTIDNDEQLEF